MSTHVTEVVKAVLTPNFEGGRVMINRKVTDIHMNSVKKLKLNSFMELRGGR